LEQARETRAVKQSCAGDFSASLRDARRCTARDGPRMLRHEGCILYAHALRCAFQGNRSFEEDGSLSRSFACRFRLRNHFWYLSHAIDDVLSRSDASDGRSSRLTNVTVDGGETDNSLHRSFIGGRYNFHLSQEVQFVEDE
jgi:hypothetical protein